MELFLNYEHSLAFKKLGFKEDCLMVYRGGSLYASGCLSRYFEDGDWSFENNTNYLEPIEQWVAAPTFEQAMDWLEDNYKMGLTVEKEYGTNTYFYTIYRNCAVVFTTTNQNYGLKTRFEAKTECINKTLKLIEGNKFERSERSKN